MSYKYLFGPVPSRRLGLSLGVDLLPAKTCTENCVYCECGKTTRLTRKRREWVPTGAVCAEIERRLKEPPAPEWLTFAGSGEPTLHRDMGRILSRAKAAAPGLRMALLTNGSLMDDPEVREECRGFDLVAVSVDAAGKEAFRRVNRPHPGLDLARMLHGIEEFRRVFKGVLWAEVFLVPGENDSEEELFRIREALSRIRPDEVQINTLDRPGTETWVTRPTAETLARAAEILGARIIGRARGRSEGAGPVADPEGLVLAAARRRPLTAGDAARMLGISGEEAECLFAGLLARGLVTAGESPRGRFFRPAGESPEDGGA